MGLRLNSGINKQDFEKQCGLKFDKFVNTNKLNGLSAEKLIINTEATIKATDSGRLILNRIIEELCS